MKGGMIWKAVKGSAGMSRKVGGGGGGGGWTGFFLTCYQLR